MKRHETLENMALAMNARAYIVKLIENQLDNTLMAFNETSGEYEACDINDERLSETERVQANAYNDIIDAILKMK